MLYTEDAWRAACRILGYDNKIRELYGENICLTYCSPYQRGVNGVQLSPREVEMLGYFSMVPLFYIEQLLALKTPSDKIVDIGCGGNIFKDVIKHIYNLDVIGIDPVNPKADVMDAFDDDFAQTNVSQYDIAFSFAALHFIPLRDFVKQVKLFHGTIKDGGAGLICVNVDRMLERETAVDLRSRFGISDVLRDRQQVHNVIQSFIDELSEDINIVGYDIDVTETDRAPMDGDIRILFKK